MPSRLGSHPGSSISLPGVFQHLWKLVVNPLCYQCTAGGRREGSGVPGEAQPSTAKLLSPGHLQWQSHFNSCRH